MSWTLGIDIGQSQDPTAVTAVEEAEGQPSEYHLRHVKRFELGTSYPDIADHVAGLLSETPGAPAELPDADVVVDATGVGRPVVEMMEDHGLSPYSIWITGGDSVTRERREFRVPKRELASLVQALLQSSRLRFAEQLPMRDVLVDELQKFRAEIDVSTGETSFEHWRERDTDDVVLALACALWFSERAPRRSGGGANIPL
ncbi:hypothetical protein [Salinibacter ruber]|uniref:hypothetical protein n=1 Tax=Salinibacter ruber TaxID=146919 RepID=UPI000E57D982|nr:hypothetical protein [Salinibacter ruber]